MNVNESGIAICFSTGFNMAGFDTISIEFTKPDGTTLTVDNPSVTVPGTPIETTAGLFNANEYAQYVTQPGDINQVGEWSARVYYTDSSPLDLISDVGTFEIYP